MFSQFWLERKWNILASTLFIISYHFRHCNYFFRFFFKAVQVFFPAYVPDVFHPNCFQYFFKACVVFAPQIPSIANGCSFAYVQFAFSFFCNHLIAFLEEFFFTTLYDTFTLSYLGRPYPAIRLLLFA